MPTIAIIERATHNIATFYEDEAPNQAKYGGPWGWPEVTVHVEVPEGMDKDVIKAVATHSEHTEQMDDETSTTTTITTYAFEEDPAKTAVKLEQQWASFRADRTRRLAETDWAMTIDSPLSEAAQSAVREYRQALRDLPTGLAHPSEAVWPASPFA